MPVPETASRRPGLDAIFSPRSVAVVGASRSRTSLGHALLHNLIRDEFAGPVYPVNPNADVVHSLRCYPMVSAIPDPVDLAVIVVPRALVLDAVEDCLTHGVRGLVVITAGFSETGAEGAAEERKIQALVRLAGARMVGPNCMGVLNTDPEFSLNATFSPTSARRGSIGFVSQSGALGVAILNVAASLGIGLTQFVSMGNKADVSGNDMLEYWEHDDATRVIAMYLESFGNPRRFTQIAKRVGRRKPILIVKSGRTEEGARAASSHTGAMAGADVTVSAFLEQCGVIRANSIEELFAIGMALDRCPLPRGDRVAIVTNAGGPAIMATDACVNLGLTMAALSEATRAKLKSFLPPEASVANPVDMIASAFAASYGKGLRAVLEDDGVDMVIVVNVNPLPTSPHDILETCSAVAREFPEKPVLAVMMATESFYDEIHGRDDLLPLYRFPETAALALAKLSGYAAWRRRPMDEAAPVFPVDDAAIEAILDRTPEGYLPPGDAFSVLELGGIPVAPHRMARDETEVLVAARELVFPVVLKAVAADLVHKSDLGGVAVDLRTEEEIHGAAVGMRERLAAAGVELEGFLVQRLARGGHEVIFGLDVDPRLGPLVMFGLGGKYVEVFRDVRFGVTPLSPADARDMIEGIRGVKLLRGTRGEKPADMDLLGEILLRLAQLAERHPRIEELDLNPFLAAPKGPDARSLALDVRIRVGAAPAQR